MNMYLYAKYILTLVYVPTNQLLQHNLHKQLSFVWDETHSVDTARWTLPILTAITLLICKAFECFLGNAHGKFCAS